MTEADATAIGEEDSASKSPPPSSASPPPAAVAAAAAAATAVGATALDSDQTSVATSGKPRKRVC